MPVSNVASDWPRTFLHPRYFCLAICDCLCKNRPCPHKKLNSFFGPAYGYTQYLSTHHVSYGQTQVVCFSEGRIYSLVKPWLTHWHLRRGVISLEFHPRPEWCPFCLVANSGPFVDNWWPRIFTRGGFSSSLPTTSPHPHLPSSHPLVKLG